jgi:hypothetical protein
MSLGNHRAASRFLLVLALGASIRAEPASDPSPDPAPPFAPLIRAPVPQVTPAEKPVPKPRPKLSPQIVSQISASVPAWHPSPPEPAEKPAPPPPDPDVVRMAPVVVKDYRLPRTEEKEWLTPKALDSALVKQYIPPFDRDFLNRYTLPIIGISPEARARTMYEEDKRLRDLKWINDTIDQVKGLDPGAAKELKEIRNSTFTRSGE